MAHGFKNTTRYAKSADFCLCTNCYATGHWHRMYLYAILYGHYSRISFNMIVLTFRLVMFQMKDHLKWRLLLCVSSACFLHVSYTYTLWSILVSYHCSSCLVNKLCIHSEVFWSHTNIMPCQQISGYILITALISKEHIIIMIIHVVTMYKPSWCIKDHNYGY